MLRYFTLITLMTVSLLATSQDDCACCTDNHNQFDFWIGEWTVHTPDGKYAGSNTITQVEDGCVLRENWTSATPGYTGTSYNFYSTTEDKWTQIWIDNQGGSLHLTGNFVDGKMVLSSGDPDKDAGPINRITWTANADGSVRQLWEVRNVEGEWSIAFDGIYTRKN